MIGQYLSNTNKIGTIYILQNILQVNNTSPNSQLPPSKKKSTSARSSDVELSHNPVSKFDTYLQLGQHKKISETNKFSARTACVRQLARTIIVLFSGG